MKKKFICKNCGYESAAWMGKCPNCNNWSTFDEIDFSEKKTFVNKNSENFEKAIELKDVEININERYITQSSEFNRVVGGGIVKDSVTILTARPGAGKSTLLLEISQDLAKKGNKVLYISGEESASQIKNRALRIMDTISENIWILSTTSLDVALDNIKKIAPSIIMLDSIQTFRLEEFSSRAGSPIQTVECVNKLVELAKNKESPKAVIMIGHMTKSDEMAGLRTLEHLVDTVLYLEAEFDEKLRLLISTKNRFGRTGEVGLFNMEENGIKEIKKPHEYFTTVREKELPGSAVTVIKEGTKLIAVEIESLVSRSFTPYPIRIGDSLRKDQLNTLVSILEEHGKMNLYDKNVILKATGGLKLSEQAVNLAAIISIVSSLKGKPVPKGCVFIGDVGLTGEVKKVPQMEQRLLEAYRMGYKKAYVAKGYSDLTKKLKDMKIYENSYLLDVINEIF